MSTERLDLCQYLNRARLTLAFPNTPDNLECRFTRPHTSNGSGTYPCHFSVASIKGYEQLDLMPAKIRRNAPEEFVIRGDGVGAQSGNFLHLQIELLPGSSILIPPARFEMEHGVPKLNMSSREWRPFIEKYIEWVWPQDVELEPGLVWNKNGNLLLFYNKGYWQQW